MFFLWFILGYFYRISFPMVFIYRVFGLSVGVGQ